jgi:hypothetical protein
MRRSSLPNLRLEMIGVLHSSVYETEAIKVTFPSLLFSVSKATVALVFLVLEIETFHHRTAVET